MMKFAKIEGGVVTQINLRPAEGLVEVPDSVVCGQIQQGDEFVDPLPTPLPAEIVATLALLEAAFSAMPKFQQLLFKDVSPAIREAVESGDFAAAREILESAPDDLYTGAAADRAAFLALLPDS